MQQYRDRVQQHGGLVGDNLQRRAEAGRVVAGVDGDQRFTGGPAVREPLLRGDQRRGHHHVGCHLDQGPGVGVGVRSAAVWPSIGGQVGRTHRRVHRGDGVLAEMGPLDRQVEAGSPGVNRHTCRS